MFRKRSFVQRVSSFRPTLEALEDRTLPSQFGDLLGNFAQTALFNTLQAEHLVTKANVDLSTFNSAPNDLNNLITLAVDVSNLEVASIQVSLQANALQQLVAIGQQVGLLSEFELNSAVSGVNAEASYFQKVAAQAQADLFAAISKFGSASANLPLLPGNVSIVSFQPPPAHVPTSAGSVTATATISGGQNTLVTIAVSGSDGFDKFNSVGITGTGSVSLTIPTGEPGVQDKFTLTVYGLPPQTAYVTYT